MSESSQQDALPSGSKWQTLCNGRGNRLALVGLTFALVYPAGFTWLYFVALSEAGTAWQRTAYLAGKTLQFALPAVWLLLWLPTPARTGCRYWRWLVVGLVFGSAVLAV